jgi:hypothetical protein
VHGYVMLVQSGVRLNTEVIKLSKYLQTATTCACGGPVVRCYIISSCYSIGSIRLATRKSVEFGNIFAEHD